MKLFSFGHDCEDTVNYADNDANEDNDDNYDDCGG